MEITEVTLSLVWFCQLFGIAPYKIIQNKFGQIVDLKLSPAMCIYSAIFTIVCTVSSNYGLLYDMLSGHPLRYYLDLVESSREKVQNISTFRIMMFDLDLFFLERTRCHLASYFSST